MATIPTFQGEARISGEAGVVRSLGGERQRAQDYSALESAKLQKLNQVSNIGEQVTGIGKKIKDARDAEDLADARLELLNGYIEIENTFVQEDFRENNRPETYEDIYQNLSTQLNNRIQTGAGKYSDRVKGAIANELAEQQIKSKVTVRSIGNKHEIDRVQGEVINKLEFYENAAVKAHLSGNTEWYTKALTDARSYLESKKGVVGERAVEATMNDFNNRINKTILEVEIDKDPIGSLEAIKKNEIGLDEADKLYYESIATAKALQFKKLQIAMFDKQEARNTKLRNAQIKRNDLLTTVQYHQGKINIKDVLNRGEMGNISTSVVNNLVNEWQSPSSKVDNPDVVADLNYQLALGQDILVNAKEQYDLGNLKGSTYSSLVGKVGDKKYKLAVNELKQSLGIDMVTESLFQSTGRGQEARVRKQVFPKAVTTMNAKINSGMEPTQAARETITEYKVNVERVGVDITTRNTKYQNDIQTMKMPDASYWPNSDKLNKQNIMKNLINLQNKFNSGEIKQQEYNDEIFWLNNWYQMATKGDMESLNITPQSATSIVDKEKFIIEETNRQKEIDDLNTFKSRR